MPAPTIDDLIDTLPGLALASTAWQEGMSAALRAVNTDGPWSKPVDPYAAPLLAAIEAKKEA